VTAEEIRGTKNESDDGAWESAKWLREIAAQLAEANEARVARFAKVDDQIAEAKKESANKTEFLDLVSGLIKPVLPQLTEFLDHVFEVPDYSQRQFPGANFPAVGVVAVPPAPGVHLVPPVNPADVPLLAHLQWQGHSPEKAQQILTNHRDAVIENFKEKLESGQTAIPSGPNIGFSSKAAPAPVAGAGE